MDTQLSDVFVPSVNCTEPCFYPKNQTYDSSQSSTFVKNGDPADSTWAAVRYQGVLSSDTVHLGEFDVKDFLFEEWTAASCVSFGCVPFGYDGALGLAPPWHHHGQTKHNLLSTLLSQQTLDKPIFSLKLPIGLYDEGQIMFGGLDPNINRSALIDLPVVEVTDPPFSDGWAVAASNISFASPQPLHVVLPSDGYAVLDSAVPYLMLPSKLATNLTAAVGARPGPAFFHHIPCERRQELPLLTFTLDGHEFSISAFDYILEIEPPDMGRTCITTFMDISEFGFRPDCGFIVLGSPFLRGFQSIWDFGEGTISRTSCSPLSPSIY